MSSVRLAFLHRGWVESQLVEVPGVAGGGVGGGMSGTATGSSQVNVMLSSLSSGRLKAFLMASVNCL